MSKAATMSETYAEQNVDGNVDEHLVNGVISRFDPATRALHVDITTT